MLKLPVTHPRILAALGAAGHLSKVLISDGHYPHSTIPNPRAEIVWANFTPGVIGARRRWRWSPTSSRSKRSRSWRPNPNGEFAMAHDPPIWAEFRNVLKTRSDFRGEMTKADQARVQRPGPRQRRRPRDRDGRDADLRNVLVTIGVVR